MIIEVTIAFGKQHCEEQMSIPSLHKMKFQILFCLDYNQIPGMNEIPIFHRNSNKIAKFNNLVQQS